MKKLLIALGLICVLIGATYGGVALAAGYQTRGVSPIVMETYSGVFIIDTDDSLDLDFAQTRHVSLTILVDGLGAGDSVNIVTINYDMGIGADIDLLVQGTEQFHTYEFDADNIQIYIHNSSGATVELAYFITTTHPLW
jgi:hypothetical protein